jgi:hypothetical protein
VIYNLTIEFRRNSDPRVTLRGLTHAQLVYQVRRMPPYATWTIRPIDADQPGRLASPLVCYAWSPAAGARFPRGRCG